MTASASAVGPPPGMRVRLSSNESAFGPSPNAIAAAQQVVVTGHLYPDDQSTALRQAIADLEHRRVAEVAVGTGSAAILMDGIAELVGDAEGRPGAVVAFERSFIVYRLAAANVGANYVEAPTGDRPSTAGPGYVRDPQALLERVDAATRVVVIDNPGNPTGSHLTGDQLASLISQLPHHVTVIVDEAYHQFAAGQQGYATADELDVDHPRVVSLRTFSKAYGLAGMRVGYLLGPESIVAPIDARRTRFNVTAPAQAAAIAALADTDHLDFTVAASIAGRDVMREGFLRLGVPFTDGLGNFLTLELGTAAAPIVDAFAEHGVGVRSLEPYGMFDQIRVSVGTPDEVATLLEVAGSVLADVPSRR